MKKMTKEIEDRIFRGVKARKMMQQEDYKKGLFWETHGKHENGLAGYLQGILDAGFTEEQINPLIDKANDEVDKLYGLEE